MQKNNNNGSILLWAIFISMIISLLFLSISTKITKNLKNNNKLIENLNIKETIKQQILNKNFSIRKLKNKEYLIFENINPLIRNLKNKEEKDFLFFSGTTINLKIEKIYGADLYYELYQGTSENNIDTLIGSGIISTKIETNLLDNTNNWGKLTLKNLGGESKIKIFSQKTIIPQNIHYKIIKIIGNKQLIKTTNIEKLW